MLGVYQLVELGLSRNIIALDLLPLTFRSETNLDDGELDGDVRCCEGELYYISHTFRR